MGRASEQPATGRLRTARVDSLHTCARSWAMMKRRRRT